MGIFDFFKKKEEKRFCPKCGKQLDKYVKYCPNCNKDQDEGKVHAEINRTVETPNGNINYKVKITSPKAGRFTKEKFTHNGVTYKVIEVRENDGGCYTINAPEYNEVLYYFIFLNKYPIINSPDAIRPGDYSDWYFNNKGIFDYVNLHKHLVSIGFYEKASNADVLSKYKVGEIKDFAAKLGLEIKGKKEDLIKDLVSKADEAQLRNLLNSRLMCISSKGKKWMEEHKEEYEYIISDDSFSSFEEYKKFWSTHNKKDVAIEKYSKEIENDKKMFGRYAYDGLIKAISGQEGSGKEILLCYIKELLIDFSGVIEFVEWRDRVNYAKRCMPSFIITFTPYLVGEFPKYKDYYDKALIDEAYKINLPFCNLDKNTLQEMVELLIDGALDGRTRADYQNLARKKATEAAVKYAK